MKRRPQPARKPEKYPGGRWGYELSERLRLLMGAEGVRGWAERVGVSASLVSSYLSGGRQPTTPVLRRIAENTGVSLDWLLFGDGGAEPHYRGQQRANTELECEVAIRLRREIAKCLERLGPCPFSPDMIEVDSRRVLTEAARTEALALSLWAEKEAEAIGRTADALDVSNQLKIASYYMESLAQHADRAAKRRVSSDQRRQAQVAAAAFREDAQSYADQARTMAERQLESFFPRPMGTPCVTLVPDGWRRFQSAVIEARGGMATNSAEVERWRAAVGGRAQSSDATAPTLALL